MQVHPDGHTYDLDWSYDEPLSVHVFDTDAATVLVGGGSEDTAEALVEIATEHGVDVVIVEHGDGDHYGSVPALRQALPEITVAVPAGDRSFLEDAGIPVDRGLEADTDAWGITPIAAPGHTPDNMAYRYDDVLIAGDTVVAADSLFAAAGDWSGPLAVCTPEYNAADALTRRSVSRLLDHAFDTVLVSHGANVRSGGTEAVRTLVDDLS